MIDVLATHQKWWYLELSEKPILPILPMTRAQEITLHSDLDAGHSWPQGLSWNVAKLLEPAPNPVCWANGCVMPVPTAFLGGLGLKP